MMQMNRVFIVAAALVLSVLIVACGGGGGGGGSLAGGGIGGTGVTSGTITGFGSVIVNGIEFETEGAARDVDGEIDISNGSDDDTVLGIGMVVTIIGTVNNDGVTGKADSIVYDDEVEGPVTDEQDDGDPDTRTFNIFDVTVVIDRTTTVFASTDYDGLAENDLLEVSGYFGVDGKLLATRVEGKDKLVPGVSEVEIKGEVTGFDSNSSTFELLGLDGITITFDNATVFEDLPDTVADGQFVEVKGTVFEGSIFASRIELEDEGFGYDVDRISIEGIVTDFIDITNFRVSGQRVNASSAAFDPSSLQSSLADGDRVEVEGSLVGGILQAREVELED
jgi:hypothetical protein